MVVLGISCYYHDSAAALVSDGKLLAAACEERFSRKKHDASFPIAAIRFCLQLANINPRDLTYVVFYEKPFIKFERIYNTVLKTIPRSLNLFREASLSTFGDKLWIASTIAHTLHIDKKKILFVPHHLSHAASAFLCSPFDESAILTVDGVGEWSTATIGFGNKKHINIIQELRFPNSVGLIYSTFTAFLGFEVNEGEYKVMGMAGFGQPRYVNEIRKIVHIQEDGSISPDLTYFSYHFDIKRSFTRKFTSLFGTPRIARSSFDPRRGKDKNYANVAASIQKVTEDIMVKMARHAKKKTNSINLCIAGGVALNGLANFQIAKEKLFDGIFIQPAAGDAGGAVGAAFYLDYYLGKKKRFVMKHVFYGESYTRKYVRKFIETRKLKSIRFAKDQPLYDFLVDQLINGKVVGWFDDRFEWGSRALGARSILADSRNPKMKDLINKKIKFREQFRPFAPSILYEKVKDYIDISCLSQESIRRVNPLDFMLYVVPIYDKIRQAIPAVTHVDGTTRPQLVRKEVTPRYHQLIKTFYNSTGVPLLLNTSFNLAGEPIVASPEDAYNTFIRSEIDILVLGAEVIVK